MTSFKRLSATVAGIAGLTAALVGNAFADVTGDSANFGKFSPVSGGSTLTVNLDKFNGALGTLTSVTFTLNGTYNATLLVTNNNPSTATFTSGSTSLNSPLTASALGNIVNISVDPTVTVNLANGYSDDDRTLAAGVTAPFEASDSDEDDETFNSNLGAWVGGAGETFEVDIFIDEIFAGGSSGGNFQFEGEGTLEGTVSVSYTFTPAQVPSEAPEPGSMALAGMGLIGMAGGIARRRKAAAKA